MNKWKFVPVEPTPEMIEAAKDNRAAQPDGTLPGSAMRQMYSAMLSAAPDHIVDANKKVRPEWDAEGNPLNLLAAAEDAHEWLRGMTSVMPSRISRSNRENLHRARRARDELRKFLDAALVDRVEGDDD